MECVDTSVRSVQSSVVYTGWCLFRDKHFTTAVLARWPRLGRMLVPVMWIWIRIHLGPWIRIHLGPWIRIRIQRYKITEKMKGKAGFNQQKYFFFRRKLYVSILNLEKNWVQ